jgi:dienelactone hydrolase
MSRAGFRAAAAATLVFFTTAFAATPRTVYFSAAAGEPRLVGYLFAPAGEGRHPAVVLLHGRAGPYSSKVNAPCTFVAPGTDSPCNAATISARHQMWGEYWAGRGYVALLVDSFGPRGVARGFGRGTHDDPARNAVNELSVRPLDAEAALAYLIERSDVQPDRVLLQGWSHGGSTALNTMHRQATGLGRRGRYAAALVFYPGCGPKALLSRTPTFDAPLLLLLAAEDEEVSPATCREVAERSGGSAGPVLVHWYVGASHDFDDPGRIRQSVPANVRAKDDAMQRVREWTDKLR